MLIEQKFIAIEGPIGVGKSSLARRLASTLDLPLLLEQPLANPFLEQFYRNAKQHAFTTQVSFLLQRLDQLSEVSRHLDTGLISDFVIQKDPLFAKITLSPNELVLYENLYNRLMFETRKPDLVVYLQAPVAVLQERIGRRRIRYEQGMDADYLGRLSEAYTTFFHGYNEAPLLIVNAADINPVDNDQHYQVLLDHISKIKGGKHFFNPLA